MPTISQIDSFADVCQVVMWCFVVWSVAQAVFRSFPAAELSASLMNPQRARTMQRLMWELRNQTAWDPRLAKGDKLAEPRMLGDEELQARAARLEKMKQQTLPARALSYLLTCAFCQNTWVSLVVVGISTSWLNFWSEAIPTALAYAGLTTVALSLFTSTAASDKSIVESSCSRKGCGGKSS